MIMAKKKTKKKVAKKKTTKKKIAKKKVAKKTTMPAKKESCSTCWADKKVQKMDACDVQCVKIGVFATALLVAKVWPTILSLNWYWYAIIAVVTFIRPFYRVWLALCR